MPEDHMMPVEQTPIAPAQTQNWFRRHLYLIALGGAGILVVAGVFIVIEKSALAGAGSGGAWGGESINLLNPTSYSSQQIQTRSDVTPGGVDVAIGNYTKPQTDENGDPISTDGFDYDSFIAELSRNSGSAKASASTSVGIDSSSWSFIPSGLISTSTQGPRRTANQQKLYDYGNEAGSYIQSFEDTHRDEVQVLKGFVEDRQNTVKIEGLKDIASGLGEIGKGLASMGSVPPSAASAHAALAASYQELEVKLAALAAAGSDQDFLAAINTYNTAAENFARKYVALATVFQIADVKFTADESGSVFTFSNGGSF